MLMVVNGVGQPAGFQFNWKSLWSCFLFALKFELRLVKRFCIPLLARYCIEEGKHKKEEWASIQQLNKDTLLEIMSAILDNKGAARPTSLRMTYA